MNRQRNRMKVLVMYDYRSQSGAILVEVDDISQVESAFYTEIFNRWNIGRDAEITAYLPETGERQ